jgi:hypothetical protein
MKKDKVISLRLNNNSFGTIQEYAEAQGLSVNAYINSIVQAYTDWFSLFSSNELVTLPKKMVSTLFEAAGLNILEQMARECASEAKNYSLFTEGYLTLETAIDTVRRISKYFVSSHIRITPIKNNSHLNIRNGSKREDDDDNIKDNDILIVFRHDLGRNFSTFYARAGYYFFSKLESHKISINHDETTVSIKLELLR